MIFPVHGLENGTVLTVYRQNGHAVFFRQGHYEMPRRYQRFLVSQGNCFSAFNSSYGRADSNHPHDSRHQYFIAFHLRQFQKAIHPMQHPDGKIRHTYLQFPGRRFAPHNSQLRHKFPDLLFHQSSIAAGSQPRHL